jgi:hypothetical protein
MTGYHGKLARSRFSFLYIALPLCLSVASKDIGAQPWLATSEFTAEASRVETCNTIFRGRHMATHT